MLQTSGELLSNGLAMVIEFQKLFQSVSKNLGQLADKLKNRQLLNTPMPEFVSSHSRRLLENPTMSLPPNVTVAQDGSGQFKTITEAVNTVPLKNMFPFVILVKAGVYNEYVTIPKKINNIVMIGEGPDKTIISGNKCFAGGVTTYDSSTLSECILISFSFREPARVCTNRIPVQVSTATPSWPRTSRSRTRPGPAVTRQWPCGRLVTSASSTTST